MRVFACNVVSKLQRNRCITFGDWRSRTNWPLHFYIYRYTYLYSSLLFFFVFFLEWSGTQSTNTEATTGLLCQPRKMMDDDECGAVAGMTAKGNERARRKPDPGSNQCRRG
jgi:hypothetical protein